MVADHRGRFASLAGERVYLNFGGQGPLPDESLNAIVEAHSCMQRDGPFSKKALAWITEVTERLREAIAAEVQAPVATVALTQSVTCGCNVALWGIEWEPGDHILLTDCEHPAVMAMSQEAARRFGLGIDFCPVFDTLNGGDVVEVVKNCLTKRTRLVIVSHVLWNTGQVLPLAGIVKACHTYRAERPISVLVDGAQSVGSIPVNLVALGADYYAFTGHKWWCGPSGVGGLYVRSPAALRPTFIGFRGLERDPSGAVLGFKSDGRRFEVSTESWAEMEGLAAALAVHREWGTTLERYEATRATMDYAWGQLSQLEGVTCLSDCPPKSGLLAFSLRQGMSPIEVVSALEEQDVFVRCMDRPRCVRLSIHYFTTREDIDRVVSCLRGVLSR